VTTDKTVIPSQIPNSNLFNYTESIDHSMYVTVVMGNTVEYQWEKTVTLSSGNTTWNGKIFYNAPLRKDVSYYVFIRTYVVDHVAEH